MQLESFYCLPCRLLSYKQCRRCFEAYAADRDKCPRCYPAESTATVQAEAFGPIKQGEAVVIRPDGRAQSARLARMANRLRSLAESIEAGLVSAAMSECPGINSAYAGPHNRSAVLLLLGATDDQPAILRVLSEAVVEAVRSHGR